MHFYCFVVYQERAYTCLGISCPQFVHQSNWFLVVHVCISILHQRSMVYALSVMALDTQCVHHKTIEMHTRLRRKQLDWCTHCGQEIPKQVYALSWWHVSQCIGDLCFAIFLRDLWLLTQFYLIRLCHYITGNLYANLLHQHCESWQWIMHDCGVRMGKHGLPR